MIICPLYLAKKELIMPVRNHQCQGGMLKAGMQVQQEFCNTNNNAKPLLPLSKISG